MPSLAIVSSYNESCGNASYTHVLRNEFAEYLDVEVIPLDLFVLQKRGRVFREHGDKHIREICEKLKRFDYVNIQFEAGLYASSMPDVLRRIQWLIDAAPNLVLTMHRVDPRSYTLNGMLASLVRHRSFNRFFTMETRRRFAELYYGIIQNCKAQAKKKNVWICVHTKRERRIVQEMYAFDNTFDYPLAFLTSAERAQIPASVRSTAEFNAKYGFPEDAKVMGIFGYISSYKGVETAIRALAELPENYYLGVFGTQHPQTIEANVAIDPYLKQLFKLIDKESDRRLKRKLKRLRAAADADPHLKFRLGDDADGVARDMVLREAESNPLLKRIRFLGNLADPDFIEALHVVDSVVLPYLEVGQSMSGVIALAMEAGARMFCANNLSFFEVRKYYGEAYHTFDIGNHVELAQKIALGGQNFEAQRNQVFERYNIRKLVRAHLEKFGFQIAEETLPVRSLKVVS